MREHELAPDEIDTLEVRSFRGMSTSDRPPTHYLEAWHNTAYAIAAGAHGVRPLRSWLEPQSFDRPDLHNFMKKVTFKPLREGELTSTGNYWERWAPTRVTIQAGGRQFEGGRDHHVPMDDEALATKFHDNVSGLLSDDAARTLERACWDLEQLDDVSALARTLAGAKPP